MKTVAQNPVEFAAAQSILLQIHELNFGGIGKTEWYRPHRVQSDQENWLVLRNGGIHTGD